MKNKIRNSINTSPQKPGVYLWKNKEGKILYVGKAENLRGRLKNYLNQQDYKTRKLLENAETIETIITKTGTEALILEDALIKQNQPRYNVRLKDDKRYPYIRVTVKEKCPKIEIVRRVELDGSRYFGPYTDPGSVKKVVRVVGELFGLRQCKYNPKKVKRPCINYDMGKCAAPCCVMGEREYSGRVLQACRFLCGEYGKVKKDLLNEIKSLSSEMEYEKASEIRETLLAIDSLSKRQDVSSAKLEDMDILGYACHMGKSNITQLKIRNRRVVAVLHYPLTGEYSQKPGESMKAFIKQHYTTGDLIPKRIYTSTEPEDRELLEGALSSITSAGAKISISQAMRGQKRKLTEMAVENSIHQIIQEEFEKKDMCVGRLESLKNALGLAGVPYRIEGYDISNLGDKHTVGGMVVFTGGKADKKEYRRFKIRGIGSKCGAELQNDPENMTEMVRRRFRHHEWKIPDLVLLDGGKAQLNACIKHTPPGIPAISIAKKFEEIYMPHLPKPLRFPKNHPGLLLLREIRDEAHRFAHTYHLKKRGKKFIPE